MRAHIHLNFLVISSVSPHSKDFALSQNSINYDLDLKNKQMKFYLMHDVMKQ